MPRGFNSPLQLYPRYDAWGSDAQVFLTVESKGTRMRAYHRLTEGQRNQVYALKKAGLKQYAIADQIGVSKSTISQELSQNTGLNERYLREWMYGVALAGYINFDKTSRKGSLSYEQQLVLVAEGGWFSQMGAFQMTNSKLRATMYIDCPIMI